MDEMCPSPPIEQNWNQNGYGWHHLKFMTSQNQVPPGDNQGVSALLLKRSCHVVHFHANHRNRILKTHPPPKFNQSQVKNLLLYMFLCGQWSPKLLRQMYLFFPLGWYLSVDGRKTTLLACVSFPCITSDQPRSFHRADCDQILKVTYDNCRGQARIYSSNSMET